jgi:hypothetical protein
LVASSNVELARRPKHRLRSLRLAQKPWIVPTHDATKRGAADVKLTAPERPEICAAGAIAVGGERFPPSLLATPPL